jgi:hypothetical protein
MVNQTVQQEDEIVSNSAAVKSSSPSSVCQPKGDKIGVDGRANSTPWWLRWLPWLREPTHEKCLRIISALNSPSMNEKDRELYLRLSEDRYSRYAKKSADLAAVAVVGIIIAVLRAHYLNNEFLKDWRLIAFIVTLWVPLMGYYAMILKKDVDLEIKVAEMQWRMAVKGAGAAAPVSPSGNGTGTDQIPDNTTVHLTPPAGQN